MEYHGTWGYIVVQWNTCISQNKIQSTWYLGFVHQWRMLFFRNRVVTWSLETASNIYIYNIAMENDLFMEGLPIKNDDFPVRCPKILVRQDDPPSAADAMITPISGQYCRLGPKEIGQTRPLYLYWFPSSFSHKKSTFFPSKMQLLGGSNHHLHSVTSPPHGTGWSVPLSNSGRSWPKWYQSEFGTKEGVLQPFEIRIVQVYFFCNRHSKTPSFPSKRLQCFPIPNAHGHKNKVPHGTFHHPPQAMGGPQARSQYRCSRETIRSCPATQTITGDDVVLRSWGI